MEKTSSPPSAGRAAARGVCIAAACLMIAACVSTQPRPYYSYGAEGDPAGAGGSYMTMLAMDVQRLACEARHETYPHAQCSQSRKGNGADEIGSDAAAAAPAIRSSSVSGSGAHSPKATEFLQAGMALSDLLCLDHFNRASSNQRHREYSRSVLNGTNGLVSTILGLTNTGSLATGIVGAGFSFAGSTAQGIESTYMVSVDLASAQALVQKTMARLADHYTREPPANYYAAERALVRYATTCTFNGVRALISQSVRGTEPRVDVAGTEAVVETTPDALSRELTELRGRHDSMEKDQR